MERSLASITTGPGETHGQEGQMSSSTMTCHGHSQDDSKYSVNENVANMNGAVDVAYPHVANEYDFDVY
jgi:hypothetical protein